MAEKTDMFVEKTDMGGLVAGLRDVALIQLRSRPVGTGTYWW